MQERTKHTYRQAIYEFVKDILVVCPKCNQQALVQTGNFHQSKFTVDEVRVSCIHCGYSQVLHNIQKRKDEKQKRGQVLIFGAPVDPFFHLPVWLKMEVFGETLWAYNADHLDFLEAHVGAKLRERNGFTHQVKSIGARLPRWMTSAKHREEILKAIDKLRKSL